MNEVIICAHCHKDPGPNSQNPFHWFGFLDKDNNEHCCILCRKVHYEKKSKNVHANKYTEFPVTYKVEVTYPILGMMQTANNVDLLTTAINKVKSPVSTMVKISAGVAKIISDNTNE